MATIRKPYVAGVSAVWELLPLLQQSEWLPGSTEKRERRKPKKERDNRLTAQKTPTENTAGHSYSCSPPSQVKAQVFFYGRKRGLSDKKKKILWRLYLKSSVANTATAVAF